MSINLTFEGLQRFQCNEKMKVYLHFLKLSSFNC